MLDGEWPLTGRALEVERLRGAITQRGPGALIVGATGAGKSRLASEASRLALESGLAPMTITATPALRATPLGAFAVLLPHHLGEPGPLPSATLLRDIADHLVERAGHQRLALVVDDAQFLDEASAALLVQLIQGRGAFVVVVLNDATETTAHPLAAIRKDALLDTIELQPFPADALTETLSLLLAGPVDPAVALRLLARSDGNLVVVRELARAALAGDYLHNDAGIWRLHADPPLPRVVADIVKRELAGLDDRQRAALEAIAFAEPMGAAEIDAAVGRETVLELERLGLVSVGMNRSRLEVRAARGLHGAVLRAEMPVTRRRELGALLSDVVARCGARREDDVLRQAVWQLDGDGAHPALLLAAAESARVRRELGLAVRLATAAGRAGGGFEAELLAAQLAEQQGLHAQADAQLRDLADRATTDSERGQVASARVESLMYKVGEFDAGRRIADAALATISDQRWRDEILALTAGGVMHLEGAQAAIDLLDPVLARSSGRTFVTAAVYASLSLGRVGRLEEAIDIATRGLSAHRALDAAIGIHPAAHLLYHCDALTHAGRFADAFALATSAYQEALAQNESEGQAFLALQLAKAVGDHGHIAAAARHTREAVAIFRDLGRPRMASGCLIYVAMTCALSGQATAAAAILNGPDAPELDSPLFSSATDLYLAWAWTAVASGDLPRARVLIEQAVGRARRTNDLVGEAVAWHAAARLGTPKPSIAHLERLAEVIEGELTGWRAAHARALAEGDADALEDVSEALAGMGADLLAAEAAADAAVQWHRRGEARRAAAAERLAGVLSGRCEGARTPALQAVRSRAELTSAERDAATMAAEGRANREIAEALGLSVRTIENQLQRAYAKLGVSRRSDLAQALEGSPAEPG